MNGPKHDVDGVATTPISADDLPRTGKPTKPEEQLAVDTLLAARYRIIRFVARGGMGEVYEAVDTELRTKLAVKVLHSHHDDAAMERVRREVQLARRVTHENVCRIFDLSHADLADGRRLSFITMELLEGATLQARLRAHGSMSAEAALPFALDMLTGLEACHRAGVIHRDLKAENILLVHRDGREHAILTDFGIANTAEIESDSSVTRDGAIVGSPAFLAPEQLDGARASVRTDVYAMGALLWELVVGPWPLRKLGTLEIMRELAKPDHLPGPVPATTDPLWRDVIERCIGPSEGRFESIEAMLAVLAPEGVPKRRSQPSITHDSKAPAKAPPPSRRAPRWIIPVVGAALVAGTVIAVKMSRSTDTPAARSDTLAASERALLRLDFTKARAEAAALDPVQAAYLRARIEVALGRWDAALAATSELAHLSPTREMQLAMSWFDKRSNRDLAGASEIGDALYKLAKAKPSVALDQAGFLIDLAKTKEALEAIDAIDPGTDDVLAARLHLARAQRLFALTSVDQPAIEKECTSAIEHAKAASAPAIEARALTLRGSARLFMGNPDLAKVDLETATTLAEREGDRRGLALLYRIRGVYAYNSESNYDEVIVWSEKAISLAQEVRDDVLLSLAYNLRAGALKEFGRVEESLADYKASEDAAVRALREDIANTRPRPNLGTLYDDLGHIKEAIAVLDELAVKRGPDRTGVSEMQMFKLQLERGDPVEASGHAITADHLFTTTDNATFRGDLEALLGLRAYLVGDDKLLQAQLARSEAALTAEGSGLDSPQLVMIMSTTMLDRPPAEALRTLERMLASKLLVGNTRGHVQLITARVLLAAGKRTEAIAQRDAFVADKLNAPFLHTQAELVLFNAELATTDAERAAALIAMQQVRTVLEQHQLVVETWRVLLGEARLVRALGDTATASLMAGTVHDAATAVGYKRIANEATPLLGR